jgi:hypothetical protein
MGSKNTLLIADIFSCEGLRFEYSSKIFSTQASSPLFLELRSLSIPIPKFSKKDEEVSNIVDLCICKTFYDRLLIVYDDGLALFDIEDIIPSRKSIASELMILNWPNKLIESITRLKKEKQSSFYSDSVRKKVKSLILEKVDQKKFENPKFTTLFVISNQIITNQIELLKENKQLSFGQIPKYNVLVQMLISNEFQGIVTGLLIF